jgi:hypothetical protein
LTDAKPGKSNNSKKQQYELPKTTRERLETALSVCIEHGKASVAAEAAIRGELDHGAPQTHVALASLYGFGHEILRLTEKERTSWFSLQEYERKDGKKLKVPYHKPAKENCFIALTKLAFPRCEDGTRSRYATILFAAHKADVPPEDFPRWLEEPHKRGEKATATGVKGAYEAYKKVRSPNIGEGGGDEPDWPKITKAALKDSTAVERPIGLAPVTTYNDGFCLALCHMQEGDPSMSLKFVNVDKALLQKVLLFAAAEVVWQTKDEPAETPAPIIPLHHPAPETAAEEMA